MQIIRLDLWFRAKRIQANNQLQLPVTRLPVLLLASTSLLPLAHLADRGIQFCRLNWGLPHFILALYLLVGKVHRGCLPRGLWISRGRWGAWEWQGVWGSPSLWFELGQQGYWRPLVAECESWCRRWLAAVLVGHAEVSVSKCTSCEGFGDYV